MAPNHTCSSASLLQSPVLRWRTSSCIYHILVLLRSQAWEKITIASLLFGGFNTVVSFVMSLELSSISWTEECPSLSDKVLWLLPQIPWLDKSLLIHLLRAGISGGPLQASPGHFWAGGLVEAGAQELWVTAGLSEVSLPWVGVLCTCVRIQRHLYKTEVCQET